MDEHDDFWRQNFVYKFIVVKCMNNSKNMEARHILSSGYGNFTVYSHLSTTYETVFYFNVCGFRYWKILEILASFDFSILTSTIISNYICSQSKKYSLI